ncbi:hypothetical protein NQZ68_027378 [Dissostichus eleginoides]|nr:hypothetical protein NQZ68_027378 [Dissostichus eleginoides]
MVRVGGRGGLCPRTEAWVLVSCWTTTMCGPLSHPPRSGRHASLNGKTDAPLLIAPKPGKKGSRNKGSHPVGREPLKKVAGACLDGFALLQRRTMQLTGAQGNRQEDIARERTWLSLSVEVDDTGFLRRGGSPGPSGPRLKPLQTRSLHVRQLLSELFPGQPPKGGREQAASQETFP